MKVFRLLALVCLLAGCTSRPIIDPMAETVDPALLVSAQGRVAPGVVVYDESGDRVGQVVKVDPEYRFPNGNKSAVLMDWAENSRGPDTYIGLFSFDKWLVAPPDAKLAG